jgi:YidC/Oxa1 family membrane protein insertase
MEDQGKRLLLAVGIVAAMYLAWMVLFPPKAPPPAPPKPAVADTRPVVAQASPTPQAAGAPEAGPACAPEAAGEAPTWDTPEYVATFSRCGGTLASLRLKGKQFEVDGKAMDMVRTGSSPAYYPLQVQVAAPASGGTGVEEARVPIVPASATWELTNQGEDAVSFKWRSPDGTIEVTKTFHKNLPSKYGFTLDFGVANVAAAGGPKRLVEASLAIYGFQDLSAKERGTFTYAEPWWDAACYVDGKTRHDAVKALAAAPVVHGGDVRWGGIAHQYFLFAAAPLAADPVTCTSSTVPADRRGVIESRLAYNTPSTLEPGQSLKQSLAVYAGPKLHGELDQISIVGGRETHLADAVDLGWFSFLARPMLGLLKIFHGGVGNWGVAIILLTITVKLLTLYWTTKSMRSMKAMSKLKPEFDKLREKYANDKMKQQEELMKLYKVHKISPLGGCLPLLLQMPIWFALYQSLSAAAELYHAPFVGWIQDLTVPDPFYVIPIVLTGVTFLQTRLSPAAVDSQQQKIMQYMMPAMLGFFSLVFPSGLGIYMLTNTGLSIGHQAWMNSQDKKKKPAPTPPKSETKPETRPETKADAKPGAKSHKKSDKGVAAKKA